MARKRRKTSKAEINLLYRKCRYCKAHRTINFFDRHERACKTQWVIRNEHQPILSPPTPTARALADVGTIRGDFMGCVEVREECSAMQLDDTVVEADFLDMPLAGGAEEPIPSE
jgi:hypothetical protein